MMQTKLFEAHVLTGNLISFQCPFCGNEVEAYTPTLRSGGKRCRTACYALFTWPDKLATRWIPSDDDWKVLLNDH